jgi:hypothetical protein
MTVIFITKASDGAHSVRLSSHDTYTFKMMIEALKDYVPACNRVYVPERKTWRVDGYAHDCLHGWLAYARATFNARIEWIGETDADPEREWTPPPPPPRQKAGDPFAVLHLRETAPDFLIRAVYKCLSRQLHPDAGGSHEEMVKLNAAYARLAQGQKAA